MPSTIQDPSGKKPKRRRCKCCKCSAVLNMPTDPTVKKCVRVAREGARRRCSSTSASFWFRWTHHRTVRMPLPSRRQTGFSAASVVRCYK